MPYQTKKKRTLEQCRRLRNKILHCNFSIARRKLIELGGYSQTANVKKVDLTGLSAIEIPVKIREAVAGIPGTYEYVSAAPTTCPGSVFGWLIAAGDEGDLLAAVDAFQKAVAIVDRLASVSATDP